MWTVLSIVPQLQTYTCKGYLPFLCVCVCVVVRFFIVTVGWFRRAPESRHKLSRGVSLNIALTFWLFEGSLYRSFKKNIHIFDYLSGPCTYEDGWRNIDSQKLFPKRIVFKNI